MVLWIQVMSRTGRVIGAKEVRVSTDKVSIKRLEATLVAGLDVEVQGPGDLQGTYIARVKLLEDLKHVGQVSPRYTFRGVLLLSCLHQSSQHPLAEQAHLCEVFGHCLFHLWLAHYLSPRNKIIAKNDIGHEYKVGHVSTELQGIDFL